LEANLAVLIDFENIAAGTEKEGLGRFDVDALMKRLKDKGRILVARSYADWGRFARFKQTLLSANITMMELTSHGMQDKNRADIAMVVDCLELAFTKAYIDTFVVVSGDSDFTPLVLKMRELNKRVIGCGTRASTSRLLIQACDEFMFYDTVVKEARAPRFTPPPVAGGEPASDEAWYEAVVESLAGIQRENPEPCLASIVKTALLRKSPDFDEIELGYASFARFLEAAQTAGYVRLSRDGKSGGYRVDQADSGEQSEADDTDGAGREPSGPWADPYLPEAARAFLAVLNETGTNPLAFSTRMTVLQALEQSVDERKRRRRRITPQFVMEDVRKRLKKTHPDLPGQAVRALFDGMMKAGLLIHKDGRPIRSGSAPFTLNKNAEQINRSLMEQWILTLREKGADLGDSGALAELFLGNPERKREVEEVIAWAAAPHAAADRGHDDDDLPDLDGLLVAEDPTAEVPVPDAPAEAANAGEPAPDAADELPSMDDALAIDDGEAPAADDADADKAPRRRRTRRKRKTGDEAAADGATDDLDAMLAVDPIDE
jgi:hypothetical protein